MSAYKGPREIVVLGGGVAGLAALDALTAALDAHPGPLPPGLRLTLVESEPRMGGRACSKPLDADAHVLHPHAPWGTNVPHGLHFVWGSYVHLLRMLEGTGTALTPEVGTSTYCAWMAPPDVPDDGSGKGRVVAVHVCDPSRPESAWNPRARKVLAAFARRGAAVAAFERVLRWSLNFDLHTGDLLSYMDILYAEEELGCELRWILLLTGALSGSLGYPEDSKLLASLLGGRRASDVDIGELMQPLFTSLVLPRMKRVVGLAPLRLLRRGVESKAALVEMLTGALSSAGLGGVAALGSATFDDLHAFVDLLLLLASDAARIVANGASYDPRRSGYLKNILKAAFSSPYALDVATSMRDAQFGVRRYEGAVLQLFDGDDSTAAWEAIAARIESRLAGPKLNGAVLRRAYAKRIIVSGGRVSAVELAAPPQLPPPDVPTVHPPVAGPTTSTLGADVLVSTLLPQCLIPLLEGQAGAESLLEQLRGLAPYMNETINLQLFFPERLELPFPPLPEGSLETPPFGISNLEGPFTIVVDLRRGWSSERFTAIRLDESDAQPFDGTAWELVGAYSDLFVHDQHAHAGRYQWPLAVQQAIAALACDPSEILPGTLDARRWLHDADAPGRMPPPPMGEIAPSAHGPYATRFREQVVPLIVATTLEQLAEMPGLDASTRGRLREHRRALLAGEPIAFRYVFVRNAQAAVRFYSAEPGLFELRPHARFEAGLRGLYLSGDWTRNGLNLQAMEAATIAGLQSAYGILEQMRAGGLHGLSVPFIDPDIVPGEVWDVGYPARDGAGR